MANLENPNRDMFKDASIPVNPNRNIFGDAYLLSGGSAENLQSILEQWNKLSFIDRFIFFKTIEIQNGVDFQLSGVRGTKIGTSSTQKLGFWGATPVVQANAIAAPNTQGGSYNQTDAQSIVTAVNSIRTALQNAGITA